MNSKDNHVKFVRFVLFADLYIFTRSKRPKASADKPYLDLDFSGYHQTSSNNCLLTVCSRTISFQIKSNV